MKLLIFIEFQYSLDLKKNCIKIMLFSEEKSIKFNTFFLNYIVYFTKIFIFYKILKLTSFSI